MANPSIKSHLLMFVLELIALFVYVSVMTNILDGEKIHGPLRLIMAIPALALCLCMFYTAYKMDRILYSR